MGYPNLTEFFDGSESDVIIIEKVSFHCYASLLFTMGLSLFINLIIYLYR